MHVRIPAATAAVVVLVSAFAGAQRAADKTDTHWVEQTIAKMSLDEKIGQLLVTSLNASFTSADSDTFDKLRHLVRDVKVGGVHVFGATEAMPALMLNPNYGNGAAASRKGDAYAAAAMLNRLQREAEIPLLTTADFEGGVGYILNGATRLPRAMAIGAARDPGLAYAAGKASAEEGRALGVVVDFYPIVDVNNNPRNPIINIRSFGEDVRLVSDMARAYIRGVQDGGMIATAKHFPGHGDTATDTHLGLAVIEYPRARLDQVELPPFRAAIEAGVGAVMTSHIALPALDPGVIHAERDLSTPATLSRRILTGLLRDQMNFDGLIYTDSMSMFAISHNLAPDRAAALAVQAGADQVLHSPDDDAAFRGIKAAVERGDIPEAQITRSVERILSAKARMGLRANRTADLAAIDEKLGTKEHQQLANDVTARALTLIKDDRNQVPLAWPKSAAILYLSVIDYASGWREGAPSRTFLPELKQRWPNVTAVEVSDRTSAAEFEMIRALARRADAIVASVFVRIASYSGRMDLSPGQVSLLEGLVASNKPYVAVLFGNPYTATSLQKLPTLLLTYEVFDGAELAAIRALTGEAPIGGKLPISLPEMFPIGHGLDRALVNRSTGR